MDNAFSFSRRRGGRGDEGIIVSAPLLRRRTPAGRSRAPDNEPKNGCAGLEQLIPAMAPSPKLGRRHAVGDRAALNDIFYVLQTGIPWEDLPQEVRFR